MTNNDRNVRTLIVCFTLALVALVPLKFYEEGQLRSLESEYSSVLGVSTGIEVILPNAIVVSDESELAEASIISSEEKCISENELDTKLAELTELMTSKLLDQKSIEDVDKQIEDMLNNRCK